MLTPDPEECYEETIAVQIMARRGKERFWRKVKAFETEEAANTYLAQKSRLGRLYRIVRKSIRVMETVIKMYRRIGPKETENPTP